jgi:SNF2 family DNA or RNA helicase
MVLTVNAGRFVLVNPKRSVVLELSANEKWFIIANRQLSTYSLKESARFLEYGDENVKKIFDKIRIRYYSIPPRRFPRLLDPHQVEGVKWILSRSRAYIAHCPGAGKTLQAIWAACQIDRGLGQVLFIVPPTLTANWAREIALWLSCPGSGINRVWPETTVIPETARQKHVGWDSEFVICPDSMLAKSWVLSNLLERKWRFLAVDEASRFKESTAQRSIALFGGLLRSGFKSSGLVRRARHSVLLDGSPLQNRPMELWAPVYAMAPEEIEYMSQTEFGMRYCGPRINNYGKYEFKWSSNEEELRERLRKNFMHVVGEDQLSHPARLRKMIFVNKDVRTSEIKEWEKRNLSGINLAQLNEDASKGDMARMRQEIGLLKVPFVARYTKEKLKKEESVLLFCWHREVAYALFSELETFNPKLIIGGTDKRERERTIRQFQSGKTKLIIGNIASLGRGHNLQNGDRGIFAEYSWNDETNRQCEHRICRKGKSRLERVPFDYIVCPNSFDEIILNSVFNKMRIVKKVIG